MSFIIQQAARASLFLVLNVSITACSSLIGPSVNPDWTSYPQNLTTEKDVKMWTPFNLTSKSELKILPGKDGKPLYHSKIESSNSVTYDFKTTNKGDKGTHEKWILPNRRNRHSENALFKLVPQVSREICGRKYYIEWSKYYYGSEATLGMPGISTPALKVSLRCPNTRFEKSNRDKAIRKFASSSKDFIYFDTIEKTFPVEKNILVTAVSDAISRERIRSLMKVISNAISREEIPSVEEHRPIKKFERGNITYIHAFYENFKTNIFNGPYPDSPYPYTPVRKEFFAIITPKEKQSTVQFIYLIHTEYFHYRGVKSAGTFEPTTSKGITAARRDLAFEKAVSFLNRISSYIKYSPK